MKVSEKDYKKMHSKDKTTKKIVKVSEDSNLPVWLGKEQDINRVNEEEEEELDRILKELV